MTRSLAEASWPCGWSGLPTLHVRPPGLDGGAGPLHKLRQHLRVSGERGRLSHAGIPSLQDHTAQVSRTATLTQQLRPCNALIVHSVHAPERVCAGNHKRESDADVVVGSYRYDEPTHDASRHSTQAAVALCPCALPCSWPCSWSAQQRPPFPAKLCVGMTSKRRDRHDYLNGAVKWTKLLLPLML